MSRLRIELPVFIAGLAVACWVGVANFVTNPLASAVTLLIGACYVAGALELRRYRDATSTLARALANLSAPPARLADWLDMLHPGLQSAVRTRIEGTRAALPGPALTPYLVGLLVLLGMFGTLLGMVVTLRGTGAALENALDPATIRASLAAPVKGLGFAFGTSIAGVATSAALGMLSALVRRERALAVQQLDASIATTLRPYSHAYQREQTLRAIERQAEAMPALVDRLQTMIATLEAQSVAANERQLAQQQALFAHAENAYARLASSVAQTLKDTAAQSAQHASAALQPVVEATMATLARETAALHETVTRAVDRHLDGLASGFATTTKTVADTWHDALAEQRQTDEALVAQLRASLAQFTDTFAQRTDDVVARVGARLEATAGQLGDTWRDALAEQRRTGEQLAADHRLALETAAATLERHASSVLQTIDATNGKLSDAWHDALSQQRQTGERLAADHRLALEAAAATFERHSTSLLQTVAQSHAALHNELASRDQQRLAAWTDALAALADALRSEWAQASEHAASRQQAICDTLATTAAQITAHTRTHANETIAEIARLVDAAAAAPKAAADVIAELREKLSDSMARDTAMLDERNRLLATLGTLLDAVNHASTDQRAAIDALVSTSAELLERVGSRFGTQVDEGTRTLDTLAAQLSGSAVEVASLGDAFGAAVERFGESNDQLVAHLQRIEAALDKSLARSDEQLAYYVAQAREVVDLSVLSQKQILEDLQRVAADRASVGD